MNCFRHRAVVAIAVCKACTRALCDACLVEHPDGITCGGRCEERMKIETRIVEHHGAVLARANTHLRVQGATVLALGLALLGLAAYGWIAPVMLFFWVGLVPGVIFLFFGTVLVARRYPQDEERPAAAES